MLYHALLHHTVRYDTILYYAIIYYIILCCAILYHTIVNCSTPYDTILHYAMLCCTTLYYAMLCYAILPRRGLHGASGAQHDAPLLLSCWRPRGIAPLHCPPSTQAQQSLLNAKVAGGIKRSCLRSWTSRRWRASKLNSSSSGCVLRRECRQPGSPAGQLLAATG